MGNRCSKANMREKRREEKGTWGRKLIKVEAQFVQKKGVGQESGLTKVLLTAEKKKEE